MSMILRIIQTEVKVICQSEAEADNFDRGLNNSWYHAKAESNYCFIIHFENSSSFNVANLLNAMIIFVFAILNY